MIRISLLFLLLALSSKLSAQKNSPSISIGYLAPYGVQFGGKVGMSFDIKNWQKDSVSNKVGRIHKLGFSPQVGYFVFPSVQGNFLVNFETVYQRVNPKKRFAPMVSIGLGYLLARQRQGGTVNLGTGDIAFDVKSLHHFVPTLNLGFNIIPKKALGYYLKGFYGRKITPQQENSALFGLETGVVLNINYKN